MHRNRSGSKYDQGAGRTMHLKKQVKDRRAVSQSEGARDALSHKLKRASKRLLIKRSVVKRPVAQRADDLAVFKDRDP
jgi:hypothetical protein